MVLDHVRYLQVFIGNQVVRRDQRVCRLPGKIFTLPTELSNSLSLNVAVLSGDCDFSSEYGTGDDAIA